MRAIFVRSEWENSSRTIVSFYFRPEAPYRYEAGQYAVITLPHANPDNRGESRTMTFSSSPSEELLRITFKVYAEGGSSYKRALLSLKPGDKVIFFDALGDMVLPLDPAIPLMFVAGGVAIASYVGIIQWLLDKREQRDITLIYAVSESADIVLQKPFDTYGALYPLTKVLYTPNVNTAHPFHGEIRHTRLDGSDLMAFARSSNRLIYLSGTESMVNALRGQVQAKGFSSQQIVFDYFDGYMDI